MIAKHIQTGLAHLTARDRVLRPLVRKYGTTVKLRRSGGFDSMARIIVGQQLSGRAADTIFGRLLAICGGVELKPQILLDTSPARLRTAGISKAKVEFLRRLAESLLVDPLFLRRVSKMLDDDAHKFLTGIKGVGDWTAGIYLMSCDARLDIFPHGDGSLNRAIGRLYKLDANSRSQALLEILDRWSPYRTVACRILWQWVDDGMS